MESLCIREVQDGMPYDNSDRLANDAYRQIDPEVPYLLSGA